MKIFKDEQSIKQLEKRRGGYYYITIMAEVVEKFPLKRATRLICKLDNQLSFQCGLNHLGDGNFFIILGGKNLKTINKTLGDNIKIEITQDPNPLGVEIPETLQVLLEQDHELKISFDKLSMGNKRHVIHSISKIKDIDKQISNAIKMINEHLLPRRKRGA